MYTFIGPAFFHIQLFPHFSFRLIFSFQSSTISVVRRFLFLTDDTSELSGVQPSDTKRWNVLPLLSLCRNHAEYFSGVNPRRLAIPISSSSSPHFAFAVFQLFVLVEEHNSLVIVILQSLISFRRSLAVTEACWSVPHYGNIVDVRLQYSDLRYNVKPS